MKNHPLWPRRGRIIIKGWDSPEILAEVLSRLVVLKVDYSYQQQGFELLAMSELFEPIAGDPASDRDWPLYDLIVSMETKVKVVDVQAQRLRVPGFKSCH